MHIVNSSVSQYGDISLTTAQKRMYPNTTVTNCFYIKVKVWFCEEYVVPDWIIDLGLPPLEVPITAPFFLNKVKAARTAPYRGSRIKLWFMNRYVKHITPCVGYVAYLDNDTHLDFGSGCSIEAALESSRRFKP